jgi:hypothetical protein
MGLTSSFDRVIGRKSACVGIGRCSGILRCSTTAEVRCVVDAAAARVTRHLGIWAESPRESYVSTRDSTSSDGFRSIARFHPMKQRGGDAEDAGSHSAAAMEHAGHHEEPEKVSGGITAPFIFLTFNVVP